MGDENGNGDREDDERVGIRGLGWSNRKFDAYA